MRRVNVRNRLATGLAWLAEQLRGCASQLVHYRRGTDVVLVRAVIGWAPLKLNDGYGGVRMAWTDRDFLIAPEELILRGQRTLPQRGDQIWEVHADQTLIYEVLACGKESEWRWSDPYHRLLRIHTTKIHEV